MLSGLGLIELIIIVIILAVPIVFIVGLIIWLLKRNKKTK